MLDGDLPVLVPFAFELLRALYMPRDQIDARLNLPRLDPKRPKLRR